MVDFSAYSLTRGPEQVRNPSPEQVWDLSLELHAAFTRVGFVFLQNTGITQHEVRTCRNHLVQSGVTTVSFTVCTVVCNPESVQKCWDTC